ncbi:MAG: ribosome maturation factor RimM [Spirochaetales bacterium]|nr:ribosome maturation factor RimM [Spirochaetales bacterium]
MEKLAIGKIRTSTGVKGFFKVLSFSGETNHFKKLKGTSVEIKNGSKTKYLKVDDVRISGSTPVMKVAGIDSPEEARKYSGWEILVERSLGAALGSNEFYLADLCKCKLVMNNQEIGEIKGVCDNGVSDMLEVVYNGKTVMIPFLDQFVGKVDLDAQTVELKEDWLLK